MKKLFLLIVIFCSILSFGFTQHARSGMYCGINTVKGPFYEGNTIDLSILGGSSMLFGGFDFAVSDVSIDNRYITSTSWEPIILATGDLVTGLSFKIGPLKPFVSSGIGFFLASDFTTTTSSTSYSSSSTTATKTPFMGLHAEVVGGIDLCLFNLFSVGAQYKLSYMYGAGFTDSYGITVGLIY